MLNAFQMVIKVITVSKRRGAICEWNRSRCLLYRSQNKVHLRKSLLSVTHNVSDKIEVDWVQVTHRANRLNVVSTLENTDPYPTNNKRKKIVNDYKLTRTGLTKGSTKQRHSFSARNTWGRMETYRASALYPHRAGMQQPRIKLKPRTIGRIRSCWKTHTCVWEGQLMCQSTWVLSSLS